MLETPGETVDYKANLYFTNPTKDEIERLAAAKRSALSRPEVVKKEYAGLMADSDVSKSLESLGREVWQSAKFKNTAVTMYMAKFMELTK